MSMDRDESIILRVGRPGAGKSWSFVEYLVNSYLRDHDGPVYTNVPLNVDECVKYCQKRYKLTDDQAEAWRARIRLFPAAVVQRWLDGEDTPQTYFAGLYEERVREALAGEGYEYDDDSEAANEIRREVEDPLARSLVVIDEAGKMWPNTVEDSDRKKQAAALAKWCRTIRHHGCKLIFVIQDEKQLSANVRRLAGVMLECVNIASRREPITGALIGDWLQLRAKLFRSYLTYIQEIEYIKNGDGWEADHQTVRPLLPKYFPLYDSHNNEGKSSGEEEKRHWERFGLVRFMAWLLARNAFNWGWRFSLLVLVWVIFLPPFMLGLHGFRYVRDELPRLYNEKVKGDRAQTASVAPSDRPPVQAAAGNVAELPPDVLRAELVAARHRASELEQRLGASSNLVYIDETGAITDDGDRWRIGSQIEFGRYKGEIVHAVDVEGGRVRLASGVVLRLRRSSDSEARSPDTKGSGVDGELPAGEKRRTDRQRPGKAE